MSVQHVKNKIIGLTGGIATGKSTVSKYLKSKGYPVIDSDEIVHHLWHESSLMIEEVIIAFALDPKKDIVEQLRTFVFNDKVNIEKLNTIVHPYVFKTIEDQLQTLQHHKIIFIDMPLLFEVGYDQKVDLTWVVYAPKNMQINRIIKRDQLDEIEAKKRIDQQMDIELKKQLAHVVIDNTKQLTDLYRLIDRQLKEV